jgi:hypothetical protein
MPSNHTRNAEAGTQAPYDQLPFELWGALRGSATVPTGTDLTRATGEVWWADDRAGAQ